LRLQWSYWFQSEFDHFQIYGTASVPVQIERRDMTPPLEVFHHTEEPIIKQVIIFSKSWNDYKAYCAIIGQFLTVFTHYAFFGRSLVFSCFRVLLIFTIQL
jgi:hypothetical protein